MPDPIRDRLNEIDRRASAATNGPWRVEDLPENEYGPRVLWLETDADALLAAHREQGAGRTLRTIAEMEPMPGSREDFTFLAAARTDVPQLVAALRNVLDLADDLDRRAGDAELDAKAAETEAPTAATAGHSYSLALETTAGSIRERVAAALNPQETTHG